MAKKNAISIRGKARWPKLDQPYKYDMAAQRSVPDPDGKLSIDVIVDAGPAEKIITAIKAAAREGGLTKVKNWPYEPETDRETGEETGRTIFKAWQYGKKKDGSVRKMPHWDAKVEKLPDGFRLTSGSEVIISVRPSAYKTLGGGVCLYLDGVQVVKYVEPDGNPGFTAVDDGEFYREDMDEGNPTDEDDEPPFDVSDDSEDEGESTDF